MNQRKDKGRRGGEKSSFRLENELNSSLKGGTKQNIQYVKKGGEGGKIPPFTNEI